MGGRRVASTALARLEVLSFSELRLRLLPDSRRESFLESLLERRLSLELLPCFERFLSRDSFFFLSDEEDFLLLFRSLWLEEDFLAEDLLRFSAAPSVAGAGVAGSGDGASETGAACTSPGREVSGAACAQKMRRLKPHPSHACTLSCTHTAPRRNVQRMG